MNKQECAEYVCSLYENGGELLQRHLTEYDNEILLHILVPDLVYFPLRDSIRTLHEEKIRQYCSCIEYMWEVGDDEVLNVVEVSIPECLTDDNEVWQVFGRHISDNFRRFINTDYIPRNNWLKIARLG